MEAVQIVIEGRWAHFKKPETNNNPLTYSFITKTALIGLIGAVLGKERDEMRLLFPQLSEDLLYGVQVVKPIKKETWSFTMRKAVNIMEKAPKAMEFLKDPKFIASIALAGQRSKNVFSKFVSYIQNNEACFTPVLGLHNCPASLSLFEEGQFSKKHNGDFTTKSFVSKKHILNIDKIVSFRIGFEKIPTYQDDDFCNDPDKYKEVIFPSENNNINVKGEYYKFSNGDCWWLI